MFIKKITVCFLMGMTLSACAMLEPPGTQQVTRICDHLLEETKTKWHNATLDEIYKDNPEAGMGQKEWFDGMSNALKVCQEKIYTGSGRLEDRLALEQIREKINQHYMKQEEALFLKRTNGKKICSHPEELRMSSMDELLLGSKKPARGCVYFNNRNIVAQQVTGHGILAGLWGGLSDRVVFLQKGNSQENNIVDGEFIEKGFFEYTGPFSYQSLLGQRTVHSFKRINGNPMEGFLFYGVKNPKSEAAHKRRISQ